MKQVLDKCLLYPNMQVLDNHLVAVYLLSDVIMRHRGG